MKRIICVIMAAFIACCCFACTDNDGKNSSTPACRGMEIYLYDSLDKRERVAGFSCSLDVDKEYMLYILVGTNTYRGDVPENMLVVLEYDESKLMMTELDRSYYSIRCLDEGEHDLKITTHYKKLYGEANPNRSSIFMSWDYKVRGVRN